MEAREIPEISDSFSWNSYLRLLITRLTFTK